VLSFSPKRVLAFCTAISALFNPTLKTLGTPAK
jgi:hypothetical protein